MLINAGLPAIYWPRALEHISFITNRLYFLPTKNTSILHLIQDLNQLHTLHVALSHDLRFECRVYN